MENALAGNENQELAGATTETAAETADLQSCVAGRELDALVAERVMGYQRLPEWGAWRTQRIPIVYSVPPYSSDLAAAMQVLEKMREYGCAVEMVSDNEEMPPRWGVWMRVRGITFSAEGDSLPSAICRAALQATATALRGAPTQQG